MTGYEKNRVYVGMIPRELDRFKLRLQFAEFGNIEHLYLRDSTQNSDYNFGFVTFESEEAAGKCLNGFRKCNPFNMDVKRSRIKPTKYSATEKDERFTAPNVNQRNSSHGFDDADEESSRDSDIYGDCAQCNKQTPFCCICEREFYCSQKCLSAHRHLHWKDCIITRVHKYQSKTNSMNESSRSRYGMTQDTMKRSQEDYKQSIIRSREKFVPRQMDRQRSISLARSFTMDDKPIHLDIPRPNGYQKEDVKDESNDSVKEDSSAPIIRFSISKGDVITIKMLSFTDLEFYGITEYYASCFNQMNEDIQEYVRKATAKNPYFTPSVNSMVLALNPSDEKWYRAKIISVEDTTVKASFIDLGLEMSISIKSTRTIPPQFAKFSTFIFKFKFDGITPVLGQEKEVVEAIKKFMVPEKFFKTTVTEKRDNVHYIEVQRLTSHLKQQDLIF